jgi:agmatinase
MINFADIPTSYTTYKNARFVIIPIPFDGTSSWIKGSDKGPDALINASKALELYDIELNSLPYTQGIFLADPLNCNGTSQEVSGRIQQECSRYLADNKFPILIGGEHSISIGSIRAFIQKYPDLSVLHFDAHTDLRAKYEGDPYSHACALHEASKTTNLIQVGIRSMGQEELPYINKQKVYFAHDIIHESIKHIAEKITKQLNENVYITIDLDVFDPAYMPSTGTPEPGGLNWYQVTGILDQVCKQKKVVGFDINELCPNPTNKAPDFLAAKLVYRLIGRV